MKNKKLKKQSNEIQPYLQGEGFEIYLTDDCKQNPRKYNFGSSSEWVGVGGEITVNQAPPFETIIIREATIEEYLKIFEGGKNKTLGYVEYIQSES